MTQRPALGKGLASLFPGAPPPTSYVPAGATAAGPQTPATSDPSNASSKDRHMGISLALIDEITANDYQPRKSFDDSALEELAQSIRMNGIIQPLVVRKTSQGYQLIAGERRLRAAKMAGIKQVPVVIRKSTDKEALELALIENIQRQDLNCVDEALAYRQLIDEFSITQEEAAHRVGKDRATVANFLRLLKLPEVILDDLKRQILSFGHGKAILSLEDHDMRLRARAQIVERKLSVRETEALVDQLKREQQDQQATGPQKPQETSPVQSRLAQAAQDLSRQFSARVEIKGTDKRGKIVLQYTSRLELDRILGTLQNERRN